MVSWERSKLNHMISLCMFPVVDVPKASTYICEVGHFVNVFFFQVCNMIAV